MIKKLIIIIFSLFLLCGIVSAESITSCTITNTNIYSNSEQYDVSPSDYSTTTTTGITHISDRYIHATGLIATPNIVDINENVNFTIQGQQGAAIVEEIWKHDNTLNLDLIRAKSGYEFTYETGVTGNSFTHSYNTNGKKTVQLTMSNSLGSFNLDTIVTVGRKPTISDLQPLSGEIPTEDTFTSTVTASSTSGNPLTYQWYVSTDQTTYTAVSGQTNAQLSVSPSSAGEYYYKVVVSDGGAESADSIEEGFSPVHLSVFSGIPSNTITTESHIIAWATHYDYYNDKSLTLGNNVTITTATSVPEFAGTLNGNSHTIINSRQPLITELSGTVQNLKFKDCLISATEYAGLVSSTMQGGVIENIDADNCNIKATNAGGITGGVLGQNCIIRNCNINLCTVIGTSKSAGITPVTQSNTAITNVHVKKSDITSPSGYAWGVSP